LNAFGLQGGIDRDLKLLMGEMFFRRMVMGFLEVARAIYFALIGFSPLTIGILITIGTIVGAFESLVSGPLSDRYGRKPFLILGGIFSIIRLTLYALSRDFWTLAIAQGIGALGEGAGAGQPVVSGYIADKTEAGKRPAVFSLLGITNAVSTAMGSLMAGLLPFFRLAFNLDEAEAHVPLFWLGVGMNLAGMFFVLPIKEARRSDKENDDARLFKVSWKEMGKYCIVRSTDGLGMSFVSSLLSLYFYLRFGASSEILAPIYALARFLPVFTYPFIPLFVSRFGDVLCLIVIRIVSGAVVAVFAVVSIFEVAAVIFIAYRFLFEFAMPVRQAFATEIVGQSRTGTIIGISNFSRSLVQSVAPTIAGYLFEFVSYSFPFFSGAALLAINGIQYHMFYNKRPRQHDGSRPATGG